MSTPNSIGNTVFNVELINFFTTLGTFLIVLVNFATLR